MTSLENRVASLESAVAERLHAATDAPIPPAIRQAILADEQCQAAAAELREAACLIDTSGDDEGQRAAGQVAWGQAAERYGRRIDELCFSL